MELIQNEKFGDASELLDNYYNTYEDGNADAYYYFYRGLILINLLECSLTSDDYNEYDKYLAEAIKNGRDFNNSDLKKEFQELTKRKKEAHRTRNSLLEWSKTTDKIMELSDKLEYDEALSLLDEHYRKHEDGTDVHYYLWKSRVLIEAVELSTGTDDYHKYNDELIKAINDGRSFNDSDINKELNQIAERRKEARKSHKKLLEWHEMTDKIMELSHDGEYDKALSLLDEHYRNHEDSIDVYYYVWKSRVLITAVEQLSIVIDDDYHKYNDELTKAINDGRDFDDSNCNEKFKEIAEQQEEAHKLYKDTLEWANLNDKVHSVTEEDFTAVKDAVSKFYENHEIDEWYYYYSALLNLRQHNYDIKKGKSPTDDEINETKSIMSKVAQFPDSTKLQEDLTQKFDITMQRREALHQSSDKGNALSEAEKEYLAELKECMTDGVISDRERRLLDKLCKSLGISAERAKELEASCDPTNFNQTEQEYADEIRAMLADGTISERERRLLNKLRMASGISEERADQIESIIKKQSGL
ncbi:MAG: TerB family tellurite resistance protein [Bacteroides sp.]|nr:TerB family tellurite resistance protein [Bacteroides sp.]